MQLKLLSVTLVLLMVGAGCMKAVVKPDIKRIDLYIQSNPDLPELDKQCIYDGRFEVGLRMETIKFLLGEPKKVEIVQQPWAVQQNWIYTRGGKKVFIIEDKHVLGILQD